MDQHIAARLRASLGQADSAADLNADGVVNVLDVALYRKAASGFESPVNGDAIAAFGPGGEQIIVEPVASIVAPGGTVSVLVLIRSNTTPLLGYSLDVDVVPGPMAVGTLTADVVATNFFDSQNLITAGDATRDPLFSVILDGGDGGVFINTITDDNSTVLAVDGVNDVLAEVVLTASFDADGDFTIQMGAASALSDANAFSVPFGAFAGTITVAGTPIPTVSQWGLVVMTILILTAGTIVYHRARERKQC